MFDSLQQARDEWERHRNVDYHIKRKHGAVTVVWVQYSGDIVYTVIRYFRMNQKWHVSVDYEGIDVGPQFLEALVTAVDLTRDER